MYFGTWVDSHFRLHRKHRRGLRLGQSINHRRILAVILWHLPRHLASSLYERRVFHRWVGKSAVVPILLITVVLLFPAFGVADLAFDLIAVAIVFPFCVYAGACASMDPRSGRVYATLGILRIQSIFCIPLRRRSSQATWIHRQHRTRPSSELRSRFCSRSPALPSIVSTIVLCASCSQGLPRDFESPAVRGSPANLTKLASTPDGPRGHPAPVRAAQAGASPTRQAPELEFLVIVLEAAGTMVRFGGVVVGVRCCGPDRMLPDLGATRRSVSAPVRPWSPLRTCASAARGGSRRCGG